MFLDNDDDKVKGAVGAVIGALAGIGIWCLIGLFGKIAFVGGFALCLGVFGGYYLLGNGLSKTGLIIMVGIILISVYFATRLNYAIALSRAMDGELSFGECYSKVMKLLKAINETGAFYKDLTLGYLVTLGGGAGLLYKLGVFEG